MSDIPSGYCPLCQEILKARARLRTAMQEEDDLRAAYEREAVYLQLLLWGTDHAPGMRAWGPIYLFMPLMEKTPLFDHLQSGGLITLDIVEKMGYPSFAL